MNLPKFLPSQHFPVHVGVLLAFAACTAQEAKTIKDVNAVAVAVTEAACTELANTDGGAADWVALGCAVAGVEGGIVKVFLPRKAWTRVKATSDGGTDGGAGSTDGGSGSGS